MSSIKKITLSKDQDIANTNLANELLALMGICEDKEEIKEPKDKKESIFTTMGYVFNKNERCPDNPDYQPFLLTNWISNSQYVVKVAQFLNASKNLPKDIQYKFAYYSIPKIYAPPYPKKSDIEKNANDMNILMHKYNCNLDTAKGYSKLLPEIEMEKLRKMYFNFEF